MFTSRVTKHGRIHLAWNLGFVQNQKNLLMTITTKLPDNLDWIELKESASEFFGRSVLETAHDGYKQVELRGAKLEQEPPVPQDMIERIPLIRCDLNETTKKKPSIAHRTPSKALFRLQWNSFQQC